MSRVAILLALTGVIGVSRAGGDPVAETRMALQKARAEAMRQPRAQVTRRESYLRRPEIGDVRLSPDGRHLAILHRSERGVDVLVQDVASGTQTRIIVGLQRADIAWSGDSQRLWLADEQGLAVMESASPSPKRILKWDPRTKQEFWTVDARAPRFAIIHERVVASGVERHRYQRVDAQGRMHLLLDAPLPLRNALLNADGEIAFTAAFDGPRYETVIRQYSAAGSRDLLRCGSLEECRLVGYSQVQHILWILSQHDEDRLALRRWQQATGRWETVHRDPAGVADADMVLWSATKEDWLAIAYHDARREWSSNDARTRAILAAIRLQLPDANLQFSTTNDNALWLVQAQLGDRAFDHYYLYRVQSNKLQPLFAQEVEKTSPPPGVAMQPVSYHASDGVLLHGYVLLPGGVDPAKAPLIAWVHGGPIARTFDRYDATMQLMVNRGYAVFVPNFRASTGYGLNYMLSANGDFGNGRALADIIDGLDFLLAQRIGDRNRQAMMGMSFGGYASLLAVSHHPARFRFAFAGAPPTEYGWIKQWQAEHDSDALRAEGAPLSLQFPLMGFRYADSAWRQKLHRESPLATLGAVQVPVYIWAGSRDDHVPLKSIVEYVGAARQLGKSLTVLIDPDGGHVPTTMLGTVACLYLMELAAHRHFGGELAPASEELRMFLKGNVTGETKD